MKKSIALTMALLLVLSVLSGCNGSTNSSSSAASPAAGTDTTAAGSDSTAASGGEVVLSYPCIWVGSDSKAEVFGKMVEEFNQEYAGQYKVKIEDQTDYDAYRNKIRTIIATGNAPDIFTVQDQADQDTYVASGKLMDLTGFLSESEMNGRFVEGILASTEVDGKNYAMPYENAVIPIMYNGKLLQQVGVTETPDSYDELWDLCEKLQAAGIHPTGQMTSGNAWSSMLWYSYALAACGGPDVYEKGFDDPAFAEAADIMVKMFQNTSSDAIGGDANVVNGHFFNERLAAYTNGTWILGRIKTEAAADLYDNLIVTPGLSYEGNNGGGYINKVQAYLMAGKQTDPAKEAGVKAFLEYITVPDRVAELSNSSGSLFAVNFDSSMITDPVQAEIVQQCSEAAFTVGHFQDAMPVAVANAFPALLESLVLGDINSEEFVEGLKKAEADNQ